MVIPGGFAQVNLIFGGLGLPRGAQVTFGVSRLDVADTPSSIGEFFVGQWSGPINNQFSSSIRLTGVLVKFGPNQTGPAALVGADSPGGAAADPDAPQVALLVRKNTIVGGRKGQGRSFWPGWPEVSTSAGGLVTPVQMGLVQADMDLFHGACITNDTPLVLLHNQAGETPTDITRLLVQGTVATQRRRLRKVGGRRRAALP